MQAMAIKPNALLLFYHSFDLNMAPKQDHGVAVMVQWFEHAPCNSRNQVQFVLSASGKSRNRVDLCCNLFFLQNLALGFEQ